MNVIFGALWLLTGHVELDQPLGSGPGQNRGNQVLKKQLRLATV